jgi:hypothetical protein
MGPQICFGSRQTRSRQRVHVRCTALGAVACELSASNYGKDQWWMLVRKS